VLEWPSKLSRAFFQVLQRSFIFPFDTGIFLQWISPRRIPGFAPKISTPTSSLKMNTQADRHVICYPSIIDTNLPSSPIVKAGEASSSRLSVSPRVRKNKM